MTYDVQISGQFDGAACGVSFNITATSLRLEVISQAKFSYFNICCSYHTL